MERVDTAHARGDPSTFNEGKHCRRCELKPEGLGELPEAPRVGSSGWGARILRLKRSGRHW